MSLLWDSRQLWCLDSSVSNLWALDHHPTLGLSPMGLLQPVISCVLRDDPPLPKEATVDASEEIVSLWLQEERRAHLVL